MTNLRGDKIILRALEPEDIDLLYKWENDTSIWKVSGTVAPFSHHTLSQFIEAQRLDIFSSRQARFIICTYDNIAVGAIDIFDFEPLHHRAGVGIMIAPEHRNNRYASDALSTLERYAAQSLAMIQLWCNIEEDNLPSLQLFQRAGYEAVGAKQMWNYTPNGYKTEIMLQKIL